MKAIIIAAGAGKRLKSLTKTKPKCMLKINGKTILRHQIDTLKACGINDIVVIKGYLKEKINYTDIRYYINDNYLNNNILQSLFYGRVDINDDVIISYSDIVYESVIIKKLLKSKKDISIVVDVDWQKKYADRTHHPIEEAENVIMYPDGKLKEIGKILKYKKHANGEFIGMLKFTKQGSRIFRDSYDRYSRLFNNRPFQKAESFEKAYLTDMLQELICNKIDIYCVTIKGGWQEIDTKQDYLTAKKEFGLKK